MQLMTNKREIKRIRKAEKPNHALYGAFCDLKGALTEIARQIKADCGENTPNAVKSYLEKAVVK